MKKSDSYCYSHFSPNAYMRLWKASRVFAKRAYSIQRVAESVKIKAFFTKDRDIKTSLYWQATDLYYSAADWYNKSAACYWKITAIHLSILALVLIVLIIIKVLKY